MKYKSPRVKAAYHLLILGFIIAVILIGIIGVLTTVNAESAPADTQHWQLLNGEDAWLITPAGCSLVMTTYGGSYHFLADCEMGKGE